MSLVEIRLTQKGGYPRFLLKIRGIKLVDIKKIVNLSVLTSFSELFNEKLTINEHLSQGWDFSDLSLLSALSFYENEKDYLNDWVRKNISYFPETKSIFGRSERLQAWKLILSKSSKLKALSNKERVINLVKLFTLINDSDSGNYNTNHKFSLGFINNYRDRYISQYYRSTNIFLSEGFLNEYGDIFKKEYDVTVSEYFHVIHSIIGYYNNSKKRIEYFDSYESLSWQLNIQEMTKSLNIEKDVYDKVMNCISFDLKEGKTFSSETLDNRNDFSLFRNKPFLKLSDDIYIPIDGKLVEDLQFNNLFYKFKDLSDNTFTPKFGFYFEKYIQSITGLAIESSQKHKYVMIPEFKYKKGQCKSPDIILLTHNENSVLVVEVKSARVLAQVTDSDNDEESLIKSLVKLKENPWVQAVNSISEIKRLKLNKEINDDKDYHFLSVTMNDIPMSLIDVEVKNQDNKNVTDIFFSMNVEAYEVLLEIISSDPEYNVVDILRKYNIHKKTMSIKTYLARLKKDLKVRNAPLISHMKDSQFNSIYFLSGLEKNN